MPSRGRRNFRAPRVRNPPAMAIGRTRASPRIFEAGSTLVGSGDSVQHHQRCPLRERLGARARPGRRFSAIVPWIFVAVVAAGAMLPIRQWLHLPRWNDSASQEFETIWRPAGNLDRHRAVDVIRTIDGDTFEARVHLAPGQDVMTRVRLRGIDAPELKAACAEELRLAEAATTALRDLLRAGRGRDLQYRPGQVSGPRCRRCCHQTHRQCFGRSARCRPCAQL